MKRQTRAKHSFFLHIRPATYHTETIKFTATWYLGFFSVFLLALECITGLILMVYYVPTPDAAYESIIRLESEIAYGWLFRDLHRLGGELMIIAALLHMIRVFLHDRYHATRGVTWATGIGLLLCTLMLAFSGYLLPWDQLAYWAVTIGCGLASSVPLFGEDIARFLRGGVEFGQDGLLRFYISHVLVFPVIMAMFFAVHYYRVSRFHLREPLPAKNTIAGMRGDRKQTLIPEIISQELLLSLLFLSVLVAVAAYVYDAPLIQHADPRHTPAGTSAPWFFLWLQGALKFGDSFLTGICFPLLILLVLLFLPLTKADSINTRKVRLRTILSLVLVFSILIGLSYAGMPRYGIDTNQARSLFEKLAPEEGISSFHKIPFSKLKVGLYSTDPTEAEWPNGLNGTLKFYRKAVTELEKLESFRDCVGLLIVEDWQADLKRITLRLIYHEKEAGSLAHSMDRSLFVHRNNGPE